MDINYKSLLGCWCVGVGQSIRQQNYETMSPIPCGWYRLDVMELIANEEAGHVLNLHLVVLGNESAQQYLAVRNWVDCAYPMKMLDLEHMPCRIQLFDVSLFSKHINYLHIPVFMFSIRLGTIFALNNYLPMQCQILPNVPNHTIIIIFASLLVIRHFFE